jgi:hypothetical protein
MQSWGLTITLDSRDGEPKREDSPKKNNVDAGFFTNSKAARTMEWFHQKVKGQQPQGSATPTATLSSSTEPNPFAKYGLPSPPQGPTPTKMRDVENSLKAIRKDGFGKYLKDEQKAKMLVFLYGRGFYKEKAEKTVRKKKVQNILTNEGASERLLRVLNSEGDKDVTKEQKDLFVHNCTALRRYFQQEGACCFSDGMDRPTRDDDYYFRIQASGNCFLHAPCVMLAYLGQKWNIENVDAAVDLSKYVRRSFPDEELYAYVVKDSGGNATDHLRRLLRPLLGGTETIGFLSISASHLRKNVVDTAKHLRDYGPGLVTEFKVAKNFSRASVPKESKNKIGYLQFDGDLKSQGRFVELADGNQEQEAEIEYNLSSFQREMGGGRTLFDSSQEPDGSTSHDPEGSLRENSSSDLGPKAGNSYGYHAMVLIGCRTDRVSNKKWLLFQNWWSDMQLVEVSDDYFWAAKGTVAFVTETEFDSVDLSSFHSFNHARVAESNLDRAECVEKFYRGPLERSAN